MGIVGTPPGSLRKSGNCRTYGIRNLEECTELWRNGVIGRDGIRYTRERIARLTEVVKCFAFNGRN